MTDNIIKEKRTENVSLFMKNVVYDSMRSAYAGDSVNDQNISIMTEEMLNNGNFEFITDSSEIWEVEEYISHICSECEREAMYDERNSEHYCPVCER